MLVLGALKNPPPKENTLSNNITLHAVTRSTLHLKTGDVSHLLEENIPLWLTPTDVTSRILALPSHEERLQAYVDWALLKTDVVEEIVWDDGDPTIQIELDDNFNTTITGDSVRVVSRTSGEIHVQSLKEALANFEGWDFEWSWI